MSGLPLLHRLDSAAGAAGDPAIEPGIDAAGMFRRLAHRPDGAWLDSAALGPDLGRWSILAVDPYAIVESGPNEPGDPLERLRQALRPFAPRTALVPGPFQGGAIGFLSYDLGRRFETIPSLAADDLGMPDLRFGLYDLFAVFDSASGAGTLVSTGEPEQGRAAERRAAERMDHLRALLAASPRADAPFRCGTPRSPESRESYGHGVRRCLDWIRRGHVYQVNLSHRFEAPFEGDAAAAYFALRRANPAPFAAYIDAGSHQILSSSPERFLALNGGEIEIRPIKGTVRRDPDPAGDARQAALLMSSAKDRAELTMIVDLCRNDLGRICSFGSVRVGPFPRLESYETVHHLVATVSGRLRAGADACDAVRACFPAGSITGAPKIRAMEIIEDLETARRGVYCGSIGWIGRDGRMDLNVAIRTMIVRCDRLYFQVGGGIVADSDPDAEYEETLHKAEGMRRALEAGVVPCGAAHASRIGEGR